MPMRRRHKRRISAIPATCPTWTIRAELEHARRRPIEQLRADLPAAGRRENAKTFPRPRLCRGADRPISTIRRRQSRVSTGQNNRNRQETAIGKACGAIGSRREPL